MEDLQPAEGQGDRAFFAEGPDLRSQIVELLGQEWLATKNVALGLRSPGELIGTSEKGRLRDLLYALSVSALS